MKRTRVLIAEDHAILREGLASLISGQADMQVVGSARTTRAAIEAAAKSAPELVLLDLEMPGSKGVGTIPLVHRACPTARVLVLTMHEDPDTLEAALAIGAAGFLSKSSVGEELLTAIRLVHAGKQYVGASFSADDRPHNRAAGSPAPKLTPGERAVLGLVAQGQTNLEVATALGLSLKKVVQTRQRFAQKWGLTSRVELVRFAIEAGLIDPRP